MERLFFAGLKHSGKTTFASLIAKCFDIEFKDSDDLVLERIPTDSVRSFYKEFGKERFMEEEYLALDDFLSANVSAIVALGGGASDNAKLLELVKRKGKLIYLVRNEEDMLPVILKDGIPPFLDSSDVKSSFHELYARRDRIYRENADLTIDLGPYRDIDETLSMIIQKLQEAGYGC